MENCKSFLQHSLLLDSCEEFKEIRDEVEYFVWLSEFEEEVEQEYKEDIADQTNITFQEYMEIRYEVYRTNHPRNVDIPKIKNNTKEEVMN